MMYQRRVGLDGNRPGRLALYLPLQLLAVLETWARYVGQPAAGTARCWLWRVYVGLLACINACWRGYLSCCGHLEAGWEAGCLWRPGARGGLVWVPISLPARTNAVRS